MKKKELVAVNEKPTNCEFTGWFWMVCAVKSEMAPRCCVDALCEVQVVVSFAVLCCGLVG